MLPILVSLGPIKIYSYGVFLALGLFVGLYFWWKMGRDEHFEEIELFDGYFLSLIVFFVTSRVAYVLFHPDLHTWYRAIALLAYPGLLVSAGIVAVVSYLVLYARVRGWERAKVMDMASVVLSSILVIGSIGAILNGSNPGIMSPWGVINVDIWTFIWSLITFGIVSRVRKQFRFFAWYKGEASVAREGLAYLFFILLTGIYLIVLGFVDDISWRLWVVPGVSLIGILVSLYALLLIYLRSGKGHGDNLLQWVRSFGRKIKE